MLINLQIVKRFNIHPFSPCVYNFHYQHYYNHRYHHTYRHTNHHHHVNHHTSNRGYRHNINLTLNIDGRLKDFYHCCDYTETKKHLSIIIIRHWMYFSDLASSNQNIKEVS